MLVIMSVTDLKLNYLYQKISAKQCFDRVICELPV